MLRFSILPTRQQSKSQHLNHSVALAELYYNFDMNVSAELRASLFDKVAPHVYGKFCSLEFILFLLEGDCDNRKERYQLLRSPGRLYRHV